MDISSQISIKPLYKITGTPENFLTALRFFIWGFNEANSKHWNSLQPGDIIFFHSKATDSRFLKKSPSSIIGLGIVGSNFYMDSAPLWIDEKIDDKKYPYKFSFSEIFLFSNIPVNDDWDSTTLNKQENTIQILNKLLENGIPLSELSGFPQMSSYSSILQESVQKVLLNLPRDLTFYKNKSYSELSLKPPTHLKEITTKYETLRYATSLTIFDDVKRKIINKSDVNVRYSLDDHKNADKHHSDIVTHLLETLIEKGYTVYNNNHIDLFAHNKQNALLIEAKSIENKNFKSQSRKGIVQLFEYNYFEVNKFRQERELEFDKEFKVLATSDEPSDKEYVNFINSLNIKTLAVKNNKILGYGDSINIKGL
jgi:hypothetical protein